MIVLLGETLFVVCGRTCGDVEWSNFIDGFIGKFDAGLRPGASHQSEQSGSFCAGKNEW